MKGSEFLAQFGQLFPGSERAAAVEGALSSSAYFGGWCEVPTTVGTLLVSCDVLSIGEPQDYYRVPLDGPTSQRWADHFGALLPTAKISDLIHAQSKAQGNALAPIGLVNSEDDFDKMMGEGFAAKHNELIGQFPRGRLIAGHKKDVILSNKLVAKPQAVAIYGFHQLNGQPIQGESTAHEATYYDYSHGVRLIQSTTAEGRSLEEILTGPDAGTLTKDPPLRVLRYGSSPGPTGPGPGPQNGGLDHLAARQTLKTAYEANGVSSPGLGELQYAQAVALGESSYGIGFDRTGFPGLHNWGAVLCASLPPCGDGCAEGPFDSQVPGGGSKVCVKRYASDVEGATDMVRILLRRPIVVEGMQSHDLDAFVRGMGKPPVYSMFAHNDPEGYRAWILAHLKTVSKALGEPLATSGQGGTDVPLPQECPDRR